MNGMELFPWQHVPLAAWLARDESDRFTYSTCGLALPRQNGKNVVLEARELYELLVCGGHVLHTAHRVRTAKSSFRRLVRYFTDERRNPEAAALVENIRYTNGEEAIYLKNGGYIEYVSRGRGTARGFDDITLVVFDEAQELTDEQYEAIKYTLAASASGDRQTIYTGTPPGPTTPGEVFARVRAKAIAGASPRTCWHEWSVEEVGDVTDRDRWYATNPSMGYLLDEDATADELSGASPDGFARERLGWWQPVTRSAKLVSPDLWDRSEIEAIGDKYGRKKAFGLKFSPDDTVYALVGAKMDSKRRIAIELVELGTTEGGTKALAEALHGRRSDTCAIGVDGLAGTDALCTNMADLKSPKGYIMRPKTADVISAAQGLIDALENGSVVHTSCDPFDSSALAVVKRPIGNRGGFGFGTDELHDPTPMDAAALAVWAIKTTKRNPKRKQRLL